MSAAMRHVVSLVAFATLVALAAACGSAPPAGQPSTAPPTDEPMPTVRRTATPPVTAAPTAAPSTPAVAAAPLLEPPPSVNAYYCVTQFDNGADKDYLWITTVRDQAAQDLRYDRQRGDLYTSFFMTKIGDQRWENVGSGYKPIAANTDAEVQARQYEVPALFTRFFLDTNSLAGFEGSDEVESASNIPSHVFRSGAAAKAAIATDELVGSVSSAAYAVSVDGGVLVEARFNGSNKAGADLSLTLYCAQYDDPSLVISAP